MYKKIIQRCPCTQVHQGGYQSVLHLQLTSTVEFFERIGMVVNSGWWEEFGESCCNPQSVTHTCSATLLNMLPGACVVSLLFCDVAQHQQFDVILYFHFQLKLMITVISYRVDKECWTDKKEQKQWFSKDIFF